MIGTYTSEYLLFFYTFIISTVIAIILLSLNFFLNKAKQKNIIDAEKLSAYECGFEPFEEARLQFNVHYYVIAILFLIFDIEIVYIFPGICIFTDLANPSLLAFAYFLTILTIGFLYEWYIGALKW